MFGHLLTEDGLAVRLAIRVADVRRLTQDHALPWIELPSGEVRFNPREVERWLQTLKRTSH